ncbi:putative membrane protein [Bradyrhizobium macuxiense]|uniref:Putative membrane protein n=2 Tax=Bradyrhizobium macuxiense TaxID=1755647 RepID=A0A560MHL2_9BRAD|nr:putative membrane protein [Bradyrhizobium macuxiense]
MLLYWRRRGRVPLTLTQVDVNDIYIDLRRVMSGRQFNSRAATMSLAPLLDAAPAIPLHAFAAMAAFVLGSIQLAAPKGTLPHRTLGWIWVILMLVVAGSSFWIHQIRLLGPWSPIHLLSIFSLVMLVLGVMAARSHNVRSHKFTMIGIFFGALVIAGLFTLMPGRIMHAVIFGQWLGD